MVSMGMLMKLYWDLYYIIPLSANPETFFLTDQPGARTAVVTERQRQPSKINIKTSIMRRDRWGWESHIPFQRKNRSPKAEQAFHC